MFLVKKFILQYIMKTHFDFIKYNENQNVWGSQCCGWVGEAREGGWRGGLYYIKIFFFSNVIIIYYIIQKKKREIFVNIILYYIIPKKKKKKPKKQEKVLWVGLYYMKILLVYFFFKCKVHLQNFTENNCYDYIYKMKFFNVTRK